MANIIIGRVLRITPTENGATKGGKAFSKRNIVLDCTRYDAITGEKGFENFPSFDFYNDKCIELEAFKVGQVVSIHFDVVGVYYQPQDKYITNVKAYKIEPYTPKKAQITASHSDSQPQQSITPQSAQNAPTMPATPVYPPQQTTFSNAPLPPQGVGGDDLPF